MTKTLKRKPKEHLVQIAIDQKYYDYLQRKTQSLGITRSEYIRALINSEHIKEKGIQLELSRRNRSTHNTSHFVFIQLKENNCF